MLSSVYSFCCWSVEYEYECVSTKQSENLYICICTHFALVHIYVYIIRGRKWFVTTPGNIRFNVSSLGGALALFDDYFHH